MGRLRRSRLAGPGITRRRCGGGFLYWAADGARITGEDDLERLRALAVPPAWSQVWICPDPRGHIQAIGVDARGRRQYRYHPHWRLQRDAQKFDHMVALGRALPELRLTCRSYLETEGLNRERVLACTVRLLDLGFFRVGTEAYVQENETYGLATIERRHVRLSRDEVVFDYPSKSGRRRIQAVSEPVVVAVVRELARRRSGPPDLLAYREARHWVDVSAEDVNAFLAEATGADFTAKEFRTWSATVLGALALAVSNDVATERGRQRAVRRAMEEVAHYLGNTPAVARSSYVDPRLVELYLDGQTIASALDGLGRDAVAGQPSTQGEIERAVLDLLDPASAGSPALLPAA